MSDIKELSGARAADGAVSCALCPLGPAMSVQGLGHQEVTHRCHMGRAQAGPSRIICSCLCPLFNQLLNARMLTKA